MRREIKKDRNMNRECYIENHIIKKERIGE